MSDIKPTEAELKAARAVRLTEKFPHDDVKTLSLEAVAIATHTRYEGKTAEEWHTAMEGECLAYKLAASRAEAAEAKAERYRLASLKADARIAELVNGGVELPR